MLVSLNNALIHMYASCIEIEAAFRVFNGMEHRTIVSWTSMITGFAQQGYGDEALLSLNGWKACKIMMLDLTKSHSQVFCAPTATLVMLM